LTPSIVYVSLFTPCLCFSVLLDFFLQFGDRIFFVLLFHFPCGPFAGYWWSFATSRPTRGFPPPPPLSLVLLHFRFTTFGPGFFLQGFFLCKPPCAPPLPGGFPVPPPPPLGVGPFLVAHHVFWSSPPVVTSRFFWVVVLVGFFSFFFSVPSGENLPLVGHPPPRNFSRGWFFTLFGFRDFPPPPPLFLSPAGVVLSSPLHRPFVFSVPPPGALFFVQTKISPRAPPPQVLPACVTSHDFPLFPFFCPKSCSLFQWCG